MIFYIPAEILSDLTLATLLKITVCKFTHLPTRLVLDLLRVHVISVSYIRMVPRQESFPSSVDCPRYYLHSLSLLHFSIYLRYAK